MGNIVTMDAQEIVMLYGSNEVVRRVHEKDKHSHFLIYLPIPGID